MYISLYLPFNDVYICTRHVSLLSCLLLQLLSIYKYITFEYNISISVILKSSHARSYKGMVNVVFAWSTIGASSYLIYCTNADSAYLARAVFNLIKVITFLFTKKTDDGSVFVSCYMYDLLLVHESYTLQEEVFCIYFIVLGPSVQSTLTTPFSLVDSFYFVLCRIVGGVFSSKNEK